ncbi:MAG: hypothetical protein WC517_01195 [Patescibacteria group bacterium]
MKTKCQYCGNECEEGVREDHNPYCPNQYPRADCREMALNDWHNGFNTIDLELRPAEMLNSPVFQLGYRMSHPDSKLGLE